MAARCAIWAESTRRRRLSRMREFVDGLPVLAATVEPLLAARRVMRQQFAILHKLLLNIGHDPVCRRPTTGLALWWRRLTVRRSTSRNLPCIP